MCTTARCRRRVICVLPLFHIYALTVILLRCIKMGDLISLHQRFDVDAVMRDIEVKRATAFPGVPTMWIAIANLPDLDKRDLSSLAVAGSGGAPLPVEVARIFERKTGLTLKMNSNDQGKVYLNGKELVKFTDTRTLEKDAEDSATNVTLKKGLNVLVLKVINEENNWQGSVRFLGAAGKPVTDLKIETKR